MNAPTSQARTSVLALLDHDVDTMRQFFIGGQKESTDIKLQILATLQGILAGALSDSGWTRCNLRKIFAYTAGWLTTLGEKQVQAVISAERDRQDELFRTGKLLFNCSSRTVYGPRKLRVLVEEIGEVAQAIDQLEHIDGPARRQHLRDELTQVAAVTVAWLESMEVKP